jgi:hypothetical protein
MLDDQYVGHELAPNLGADFGPIWPSELIDAGITPDGDAWPAWLTDLGPVDLLGRFLPQGPQIDIGAIEALQIPGDYNHNDEVDAADYVLWRQMLGATGSALIGDGDHNGAVNAVDYEIWSSNFGRTLSQGTLFAPAGGANRVPEPTGSLLSIMLLARLYIGQIRRYRS